MNMFVDTTRTTLKAFAKKRASRLLSLLLIVAVAGGLVACDQFDLGEAQPTGSVSLPQTVSSQSGFEGLLNSAYDRLQDPGRYGERWMLVPEALTDNAAIAASGGNRYPSEVANVARTHLQGYGGIYSTINEMNIVLDNIGEFTPQAQDPQALKDRIRGEARFLRALAYFDLVRLYSYMPGTIDGRNREPGDFSLGVPISLEPTLSAADAEDLPRSENTAVYDQVVDDFDAADSLLAGNAEAPSGPNKATAAAAAGMLSRVHLYLTNWQQAEAAATRAINLTGAEVVDSRSAAFEDTWEQSSHPGSIFELTMTRGQDATGANGNSLQDLTFFTDPNNDGEASNFAYQLVTSADVRSIFASNDARQSLFATDPAGSVYIEKYNGSIAPFTDRIPLLRVAELYLNRAEARAQQNNSSGAQSDLNYIRVRRGLSRVSPTGQALVDEILEERRREFLFEGKRLFTLKRYARDIPKPQGTFAGGVSIDFDGPLSERRLVLPPLPQNAIQSNPALEQNPGY